MSVFEDRHNTLFRLINYIVLTLEDLEANRQSFDLSCKQDSNILTNINKLIEINKLPISYSISADLELKNCRNILDKIDSQIKTIDNYIIQAKSIVDSPRYEKMMLDNENYNSIVTDAKNVFGLIKPLNELLKNSYLNLLNMEKELSYDYNPALMEALGILKELNM